MHSRSRHSATPAQHKPSRTPTQNPSANTSPVCTVNIDWILSRWWNARSHVFLHMPSGSEWLRSWCMYRKVQHSDHPCLKALNSERKMDFIWFILSIFAYEISIDSVTMCALAHRLLVAKPNFKIWQIWKFSYQVLRSDRQRVIHTLMAQQVLAKYMCIQCNYTLNLLLRVLIFDAEKPIYTVYVHHMICVYIVYAIMSCFENFENTGNTCVCGTKPKIF